MKGKQTALMPGNEDRVGYWLTPGYVPGDPQTAPYTDLMAELQAEFDFDFDACPWPRPAGFDGLKEPWGARTWCNPPFQGANLSAWARKAVEQRSLGKSVVIIMPVPSFVGLLLDAGAEARNIGEVKWYNPRGQQRKRRGWPFVLFILRPKP